MSSPYGSRPSAKWLNSRAIEARLQSLEGHALEQLDALYFLSRLAMASIPRPDYHAPDGLERLLPLSTHAKDTLQEVEHSLYREADIAHAFLIELYHHDLFFDLDHLDAVAAISLYDQQLRTGELRLAPVNGRHLYNKFFELGLPRHDHLLPHQVDELLADSEHGVYQIGPWVTGPLGIVRSAAGRVSMPTRNIPLWHCADTGCQTVHYVELRTHDYPAAFLAKDISNHCDKRLGPYSEWGGPLLRLHRRHDADRRSREYYDLPAILCDAIPLKERSALLAECLSGETGVRVRALIDQYDRGIGKGSPKAIAERLGELAQVQLLLSITDVEIVQLIDRCIASRIIDIPATEVRSATFSPKRLSAFDSRVELSMFGARSKREDPAVVLSTAVWDEYEDAGLLSELAWKCQMGADQPRPGAVLDYMRTRDPRDVVRSLVLSSRPITMAFADRFQLAIAPLEDQEHTIDRVLWKVGFDTHRYDQKYNRLWAHLQSFREELISHRSPLSADNRDSIRSRGVSLFVLLEDVLEEMVGYAVWLLSSDHFADTKFEYRRRLATNAVADQLGDTLVSGNAEFRWDRNGGNTLGSLLAYARAASNWVKTLVDRAPVEAERPESDFPHYANVGSSKFAFAHTQFWADAAKSGLSEFSAGFDSVISQLEQSDLAGVRNGLNHHRDERRFPSIDSMLVCESRVRSAIETADVKRLLPKVFWLDNESRDYYGLIHSELVDYRGRKLVLSGPPPFTGFPVTEFSTPSLVPFGGLLGWYNAEIIFQAKEESAYTDMWSGYPLRPAEAVRAGPI